MKKMECIFLAVLIGLAVFLVIARTEPSDEKCKQYILNHQHEIVNEKDGHFRIPTTDYKYYTDITIRLTGENSYMVVFWGNRDSFFWRFRLDRDFSVDVKYNEYKGKDVTLDLLILKILKITLLFNEK